MDRNYWQSSLSQRISRRRALVATSATALSAAFLAACGGSSDKGGSAKPATKDASGLLTEPADTTKSAVRGGILKRVNNANPPNLDPLQQTGAVALYETVVGRLVGFKPGLLTSQSESDVAGDLCDSWEFSPDRLTITLKMRPGVKWHNIAPVNGRNVNVDDVLFTWKRFVAVGAQRSGLANSVNPDAPIISMTAPDSKTIVVKMKDPIVYGLSILGGRENVNLMPKEAEGGYDPRAKLIGTGPYFLSDFQPSIGYTLKRFDGFYDKTYSFADQIDYPAVPEYATAAAQFRTGAIYTYPIRQEEVVAFKKDVPDIGLFTNGYINNGNKLIFGWKTKELRDDRVRQAFSMSYDRDLWIDVWNNASKFEEQGIPVDRRWMSNLQSISEPYDGWRVEPRDPKAFGPNAKYYKHNVAEAKKLLSAAGIPNGMELQSTRVAGSQYGVDFAKQCDAREGMNAELGFKFTVKEIDYQTEFIPKYRDTKGNWEGISYKSGPPATSPDPVGQFNFNYSSKAGVSFYGFDAAGKGDNSGDPYVDETLSKAQQEIDDNKRKALINDLDKYLGEKQYAINGLGGASGYALAWPAIGNYRVWRGGGANTTRTENQYWWVDATKAPLKKA